MTVKSFFSAVWQFCSYLFWPRWGGKSKENGNQKPFEKMIIMKYDCVGIGVVKMTVLQP